MKLARALLAVLPSLAMLPVAEVVLRAAIPDVEIRTPLARGGFLRPYVPNAEADLIGAEFRVRYAINEYGFRDLRGRAMDPDPTRRHCVRIVLLGDSFSEGYGVEARDSFARLLEKNRVRVCFEVWSLARMGASPLFHVVMAREFVPRLRPDIVVVQLFDNDLDENRFRHLPRDADGRVGPLPDRMRPPSGALATAIDTWRGFALVQAFGRLEDRLSGKGVPRIFVRPGSPVEQEMPAPGNARLFPWYDPARAPEWEPKLAEQEVLVRQLVEELRAMRTPDVLLVYVPHGAELVSGDPEVSRARNPHAQRLARLARELDVPFLDGIDVFTAPGVVPGHYYLEYDQHWNTEGHALFAEALRRRLLGPDLLGRPIP
jgi:hypothetical protein